MIQFTDWRGTPIDVGSIVVYPSGERTALEIVEAEIVSITPDPGRFARSIKYLEDYMKNNGYEREKEEQIHRLKSMAFKVKVRRIAKGTGFSKYEDKDRLIALQKSERVTVIQ